MIYTNLNKIRAHNPSTDSWQKLLTYLGKTEADDEPLALVTVLDSNGLDDALWCLRAEPQHANIWRMFAVRCARRVQHLLTDERSIRALDVAERHAHGLATYAELFAAWDAAWDAARYAVRCAARHAARYAARCAAWAVTMDAARGAAGVAQAAARYAAHAAVWAAKAARDTARATAEAEQTADFRAMLAAHHAMPLESCALVDWWQEKDNEQ